MLFYFRVHYKASGGLIDSSNSMKSALKKVYKALPFKQEMFSLVKKVWSPGPDIFRHLYFNGQFKVDVDSSHSFFIRHFGYQIENEIFWCGLNDAWEKTSIRLWQKAVKRAGVIFDIGANTGLYALVAKSLNPNSRVIAFEPVKRVYSRLLENNQLNNYDIECFELAASNADGEAIIYDLPTEHILSVTVNQNHKSPEIVEVAIPTTINIIRLDTFINKQKLERVDLMKIDVERHEVEVLEGMGSFLEKFRPAMLIEILENEIGEKVESLISDKDYLYFRIDDENGTVNLMEHIRIEKDCNFFLCDKNTAKELMLL
jgi:FkbM family methyltransferase